MCQHRPSCAGAPDCQAARAVASHPEQGWSLLCYGVVAFDDTGVGTPTTARLLQRWVASLHARGLLAVEPALRRLQIPALIVWGTGMCSSTASVPTGCAVPSPVPWRWPRYPARGCSWRKSAPQSLPRPCAALVCAREAKGKDDA